MKNSYKFIIICSLFVLALASVSAIQMEDGNYKCYYISSNLEYSYLECLNKTYLYDCKVGYYSTKETCLKELENLNEQPVLIRDLKLNILYIGGQFYQSNPALGFEILIGLIFLFMIIKANYRIKLKK